MNVEHLCSLSYMSVTKLWACFLGSGKISPCVFKYLFFPACEACSDQIPKCQEGEVLIVDGNTTERCCPTYHCSKFDLILIF